jgi:hypothetical protein
MTSLALRAKTTWAICSSSGSKLGSITYQNRAGRGAGGERRRREQLGDGRRHPATTQCQKPLPVGASGWKAGDCELRVSSGTTNEAPARCPGRPRPSVGVAADPRTQSEWSASLSWRDHTQTPDFGLTARGQARSRDPSERCSGSAPTRRRTRPGPARGIYGDPRAFSTRAAVSQPWLSGRGTYGLPPHAAWANPVSPGAK